MFLLHHLSPIHLARKNIAELDYIGYVIIVLTLLITLPQVILIYENESAKDVSLVSWVGYLAIGFWWLFYGVEKNVKPMIVSSAIHIIVNSVVVYGIIKFEGIDSLFANPFF